MFCDKCGNKLNEHSLFCGECGKSIKQDALQNSIHSQLLGYWLCESSTSTAFLQLSQSGVKIITQYLIDGTGVAYYTREPLITHISCLAYHRQPFAWTCDDTGRVVISTNADGEHISTGMTCQISESLLTIKSDDGNTAIERKLPDSFFITLSEDNADIEATSEPATALRFLKAFGGLCFIIGGFILAQLFGYETATEEFLGFTVSEVTYRGSLYFVFLGAGVFTGIGLLWDAIFRN